MDSNCDFEVLIASLNGDKEIYNKANLKCNCIIANQTDGTSFSDNGKLKYICTNTRGVGKNRNVALIYASAEWVLFGDDDVTYVDDLETIIKEQFEKRPQADVLIFNIETLGSTAIKRRLNNKSKRVHWYNYMNYGAVRIACRLSSIKKANIHFSELFGGGAIYSCGEDTIFLSDCLKNKLKIYTVPVNIAVVDQSSSTWFEGYNQKYFHDKGALFKKIYPKIYRLFLLYYSFKMRSPERSFRVNYKDCIKGAKDFKALK